MKVYHKALVAAGLVLSMALGMTGCAGKALDGSQVVATVGEKEMKLGEANFLLRYQQVQTESYYESLLGEGIYAMDLYGDGTTFGDSLKSDAMAQMQEYYILEEKAAQYNVTISEEDQTKISEAAAKFMEDNNEETKKQMTADQATIERILTLMTIRHRVTNAVYEEANVTVTDEEAAQRGFAYISVAKESGGETLTAEQIQENKDKMAAVAESVKSGNAMEGAAIENGLTAYTGNYGKDTTSYNETMITALDALKEGEVSEIIETDTQLYLLQVTAEVDEAATASTKESLTAQRQAEYYEGVYEGWKAEYPLTVVEDVWEDVVFNRSYEIAQ